MKRFAVVLLSLLMIGLLAACSGSGAAAATSAPSGTEAVAANGTPQPPNGTPGPGGFAQNPTMQLLLGTFALENTDNAVTAEQAATLLPLWQGVQALSTSDTTASEELTAVETQLHNAYTTGQLAAIEALTPEQMQQVMADQGLNFGGFGANGTPDPNATPGAGGSFGGGAGGPPDGGGAGGGPDGGGGGFDPSNLSPEQQATFEARRAQGGDGGFGGRGGVPAPLLQAVIDLLTARASS